MSPPDFLVSNASGSTRIKRVVCCRVSASETHDLLTHTPCVQMRLEVLFLRYEPSDCSVCSPWHGNAVVVVHVPFHAIVLTY